MRQMPHRYVHYPNFYKSALLTKLTREIVHKFAFDELYIGVKFASYGCNFCWTVGRFGRLRGVSLQGTGRGYFTRQVTHVKAGHEQRFGWFAFSCVTFCQKKSFTIVLV